MLSALAWNYRQHPSTDNPTATDAVYSKRGWGGGGGGWGVGGRTGAASADADGPCPQRATGRRQPAADRTSGGGGSPRSAGSEAS